MKKQTVFCCVAFIFALLLLGCKHDGKNSQAGMLPALPGDHLDRYEMEIQAYEAADAKEMPAAGGVLFAGSSSIRLWSSVASDFAPLPVTNRGFGGSTLPEVEYYAPRIIYKYRPKVMVLYCGENDMAENTAPPVAFQRFKKFIGEMEKNLPNTSIVVISAKPSPSRWALWKSFQQFNDMVAQFAENRPNLRYVDIGDQLLGTDGMPDPALFTEDKLHMNVNGYAKWTSVLKPVVTELYRPQALQ